MILSDNCKYKYMVKCESGDEYIVCDNQECQKEKEEKKNDCT